MTINDISQRLTQALDPSAILMVLIFVALAIAIVLYLIEKKSEIAG